MKRHIVFLTIVCILFSSTFLLSCSSSTSEKGGNKVEHKKIALLVSTLDNPFFKTLRDGAEKKAKAVDYELIVEDSKNDSQKEKYYIDSLINQDIDILIINPTDSNAISASIIKANNAGIPVITVDRQTDKGYVECHISSDNIKGGQLAAAYISEKLGLSGKIIELGGIEGASATKDRGKGFHLGLSGKEGLKIIKTVSANFDFTKGFEVMKDILKNNSKIDAIFAHNDQMALGALKALKESKKSAIVVGFDGIPSALESVKKGELSATIAQQPDLMGSIAVENAIKVLKGESIEKQIYVDLKIIKK